MPPRLLHPDEYELVGRDSNESNETFDLDEADFQSQGITSPSYLHQQRTFIPRLASIFNPLRLRAIFSRGRGRRRRRRPLKAPRRPRLSFRKAIRRVLFIFYVCLCIVGALVLLTAIFRPSYARPPAHYQTLRRRVKSSEDYGRANPENQKIFIAASIYDAEGHLLGGHWGEALLKLIDILGNRNVFLSIYENNSGENGQTAQIKFERRVQCPHSMVLEDEIPLEDLPHVTLPDGSERTKRIAFLAEARNRALQPLAEHPEIKYDKLLYLNDAVFDPIEAAQLLLSTNLDEHGHTAYRAACAVDFINPFKFYDTYATRDMEGYSMGVPFFPWFTDAGNGFSRQDVLDGKDAVRVKSCWGGMVAFDAKPFQGDPPLRFRSTPDTYWDASECCLIHADLLNQGTFDEDGDFVGIYMNPFVRTAYDNGTLWWLPKVKRFERLYTIPHNIVNHVVGLPWFNPRRTEIAGAKVLEEVWTPDKGLKAGGSFQTQTRKAQGDGYCGKKMLQLIKDTQRNGEKNWEIMPLPPG
ncbi:hypothetical protein MMC28_003373 [Mycoblastus sanguinarius]|nr:hypothetical protein [Mycoblastus sanguinarius]